MEKVELEKLFCSPDISIKAAMEVINRTRGQMIVLIDENDRLLGVLTDGDIRRALLEDAPLSTPVSKFMTRKPKQLRPDQRHEAPRVMKEFSIKQVLIVDDSGKVQDIILWGDVVKSDVKGKLENRVFIMAGGKGSRLDPFTKILPKALIPIGDKPIIELVMDKFRKFGFYQFILSLNYKAAMVRHYFAETEFISDIRFIQEDKPLGTAGSLCLAKAYIKAPFILTNCDILIDIDYGDVLKFHNDRGFHVTVVGVVKNFTIPYGVIKMNGGCLVSMMEKPEYDFIVNAGVYVIEPTILNILQENCRLDMPELLESCRNEGFTVGVYPFSGDWIDVGQLEEYKKALSHINI